MILMETYLAIWQEIWFCGFDEKIYFKFSVENVILVFCPENMIFFLFRRETRFYTENNFAFLVEKCEFAVILQLW